MKFSVWAPLAQNVKLELGEGEHPMHREEQGWWTLEQPAVSGETRYRFRLDDQPPRPDPRSRWQPDGVHAASCVWDTAQLGARPAPAFNARPLREAVIYELHIGTFTPEGTYVAARGRLPYLRDLGVTHLEVMPLSTFPGERGWGYDGVYFYAPHPTYGTPGELAEFIDDCHQHGLAVLLDVVYNHFGPDGNYVSCFGPYFTAHWKTPWGDAINYDGPESDSVRAFIIDNALMWLRDYRFDGLRLDAVQAIIDSRAKHVLEELSERVGDYARSSGRNLLLIAESDRNDPRYIRPPALGGYGLDGHWADDFHHALHRTITGETAGYHGDYLGLDHLAKAIREGYIFTGQYSNFRRHSHGRPPEGVAPEQLIICAQNHDQVGNRALGERLSMLLPVESLKAISALVLLTPFTPLLFQGEEWGAQTPFLFFTDHHEPELAHAVTEGRRREFAAFRWEQESVPDPQERSTFTRSKLRWEELEDPVRRDLLEWHKRLLALRHQYVCPDRADREVAFDEAARWMTVRIGRLLIMLNLASHPQPVPVPNFSWQHVLSSVPVASVNDELPAGATAIWVRADRAAS